MARYISAPTTLPTTVAPFISGVAMSGLADRVAGLVFSNQAGTLLIQQSLDGGNWDYEDSIAVLANVGKAFSIELYAPYYRVKYTPTVNPTVFRLAARQTSAGPRS